MKPTQTARDRVIPEIQARRLSELLERGGAAGLGDVLGRDAATRRWHRGKARNIAGTTVRDVVPVPGSESAVVLIEFSYADGDGEVYLVPVALARQQQAEHVDTEHGDEVIARVTAADGERAILHDALWDPGFTRALLKAIAGEARFAGGTGELAAQRTEAFDAIAGGDLEALQVRVSKAEQSNSSVFYGDRLILKLFRKLEAGINPDVEISRFLTERGYAHTPAVAGHIEYRGSDGSRMAAGILQQFVENQGDAWEYTLRAAGEFYHRVASRAMHRRPVLDTEHPLKLIGEQPAPWAAELLGSYPERARLLGERTAELHVALCAANAGPDFAPEPFTRDFREGLYQRLIGEAERAIGLVRANFNSLAGAAAEDAQTLIALELPIRDRFREACEHPIDAVRIRHHGDLHLGQVLVAGSDFFLIDFEGEPARPLEERRMKRAAMRDVAGMVRSFQYAAWSALLTHRERYGTVAVPETWAAFWTAWVSAAFVEEYFRGAAGQPFVPALEAQRRALFDVCVLEKALYEVTYELNNRPDWVGIPLHGVAALMR